MVDSSLLAILVYPACDHLAGRHEPHSVRMPGVINSDNDDVNSQQKD